MFLTNIFRLRHNCEHDKITPDMEYGYCPDCGKLVYNDWYITRCSCCGVKMRACIKGDEIIPQNHYCVNCGSKEYTVEKIPKINFVDINFAVLKKNVVEESANAASTTQCWTEKTNSQPKLTVKFL